MANIHLETALKKARWKIIPLLILMYALSILDRTNVGFVKSQLDIHLGIDASAFALGVGIFFIGYSIFQIPSNLVLQKIGARKWLSTLMILWGIITFLMMYITGPLSFYFLRFILGIIEAGFYPGIILFLSYWFPENTRSQAIALVQLGAPIALILGAPLTGLILDLPSITILQDWQLVFGIQGIITIIAAIFALIWLVDNPNSSKWLTSHEKISLTNEIAQEDEIHPKNMEHKTTVLTLLKDLNIWFLIGIYFSIQINLYAILFYLPSQLSTFTNSSIGLTIGLLISIPWTCSMILSPIITRKIDKLQTWKASATLLLPIAIFCILLALLTNNLIIFTLLMSIAITGFMITMPLVWNLVTIYLQSGKERVIGTALVGTIGTLGGFISPILKNWAETYWQNDHSGIISLCIIGLIGVVMLLTLRPINKNQ